MEQDDKGRSMNNSEDVSIAELADKVKLAIIYIRSKWVFILIVSLFGALLGLYYSIEKKPTYTAVCTFVLEDAKSSGGLGQYGGLASLAGINLGDAGGGIFQGDNILELYKSRTMIERALLSDAFINGKKQKLINRYISFNKLRENEGLNTIQFDGDPDKFNRNQDSIITGLVDLFIRKILSVSKPDKKLSIIRVSVETTDELFSKFFTEKLVQNVNDFYVQTKTKKSAQNAQILQHQADSVRSILNSSINGVASAIDAAPNANPDRVTLRVASQKKQIDVQANTAIYSEIVKNLELAKISLRQDVPLIQVIDKPVLPLKATKTGKIVSTILCAFLSIILVVIFLLLRRAIKKPR